MRHPQNNGDVGSISSSRWENGSMLRTTTGSSEGRLPLWSVLDEVCRSSPLTSTLPMAFLLLEIQTSALNGGRPGCHLWMRAALCPLTTNNYYRLAICNCPNPSSWLRRAPNDQMFHHYYGISAELNRQMCVPLCWLLSWQRVVWLPSLIRPMGR